MKVGGYRPANSWLRRQLDTRWQRWLIVCFAGSVVVSVVMTAFIAPRQATLRMRYEIAQLTRVIDQLERQQRHLVLEKETLSSPAILAADLGKLGLVPLEPGQVEFLTQAGELVHTPATPTPRPTGARAPRRGR
jgi:hypothetical protein